MTTLVFDIETVGEDFDALDETTQKVLTRWIEKSARGEEEYRVALDDLKDGLGFSPLTGEIVAIGVLDHEKQKGVVYYQAPGEKSPDAEENGIVFKAMDEAAMLKNFWDGAMRYDTFATFNGRGFDVPFLMVRSAVHGIRPSVDLMDGRYLYQQRNKKHIDLQDQLSFYGAVRRPGALHTWCRAFGITSPKEEGTSGDDVARLFKAKRYRDIAHYNAEDVRATSALYDKWLRYFS